MSTDLRDSAVAQRCDPMIRSSADDGAWFGCLLAAAATVAGASPHFGAGFGVHFTARTGTPGPTSSAALIYASARMHPQKLCRNDQPVVARIIAAHLR